MKMKPGDYILREDIPDEGTHNLIREAATDMGYNVGVCGQYGNGGRLWNALRIANDNRLEWCSESICEGSRLHPSDILGDEKPQGHPAADLLAEIAEVARTHPEPWREFEWWNAIRERWVCEKSFGGLIHSIREGCDIRRKPRTITINGHEVLEPVREPLERGDIYAFPCTGINSGFMETTWTESQHDYDRLDAGLIHLTRAAAVKHAEALISFTAQKDNN